MIPVSKEISQEFALMRFISAVCVVFLHMGVPLEKGSSGWWLYEISQVLCWFSVPFFFLASGSFLAGHVAENGWYGHAIRKRVRTILFPFWIWGVIWGLYSWLITLVGRGESEAVTLKTMCRIFGFDVFSPPFYSVTWFLRALFFLVIFSPCIEWLTRKRWMVIIFMAFELVYCMRPHMLGTFSGVLDSVFAARGLGWFALGMALRLRRVGFPRLSLGIGTLFFAIAVALSIASAYVDMRSIFMFCATPFMLFFLHVNFRMLSLPHVLNGCVFPLFLLHPFCLSIFNGCISSSTDNWLIMIFRVGFAIVVSIGATIFLRKTSPKLCTFLWGGR